MWLIVPCYNEAQRFDAAGWRALAEAMAVRVLFIDDGSTDDTQAHLKSFTRTLPSGCAEVQCWSQNLGKGEAVRWGMRHALSRGARWVGYADADLATPPAELVRLMRDEVPRSRAAVLGSRAQRLGAVVQRRPGRLFLGRLFAATTTLGLQLPVHDTQCGAKFFRATPLLAQALQEPFISRWIFDVELLGRLIVPLGALAGLEAADVLEVPLRQWQDKPGSKLTLRAMARAAAELPFIALALHKRRLRHYLK